MTIPDWVPGPTPTFPFAFFPPRFQFPGGGASAEPPFGKDVFATRKRYQMAEPLAIFGIKWKGPQTEEIYTGEWPYPSPVMLIGKRPRRRRRK